MKIICKKEILSNIVSKAEKITGKNLSLPVLNNIIIDAQKSKLIIRATNLDLGIELYTNIKIEKEGSLSVSGSILQNVLSNIFDDEEVVLEEKEGFLIIKTKHTESSIKTQPITDFPGLPKISEGFCFSIDAQTLSRGFKSVWYSSSTSNIKPELSSIYLYTGDSNEIVFVATDSFRLAEKKIKLKKLVDIEGVLIPFKNVVEISRILDDVEGEVDVCLDKNQISFSSDNVFITSRIVDGVFPDYKQIIPKEFSTEIVALKQDILQSLKMANVFSDKFNQVKFSIKTKEKTFEIETKNTDVGQNKSVVDSKIEGEDLEINFNQKYVIDCFQSLESDSVVLKFNGMGKPLVIQGISDRSFLYLVMPMNK